MSGLGQSTAKDILHQWLTDTLKSVAVNAFVEGVDATYPDRTDPERLTNYTQIVRVGYEVTDTERAVNNAGFNDRYAYEAQKALKEWSNDAEYALMGGSLACASGSAARQLKGVKNWMTSNNYTYRASGVSLSEAMLNDGFQAVWDDGTQVNALYVPMALKRRISGFTAGSTRNVSADDKRLVAPVDVYEADAANMVKIFPHRYVSIQVATDTSHQMVGLDEDKWRVAFLRKPFTRELSKTGDSTKGEVVGELTLECLHKNSGFAWDGML